MIAPPHAEVIESTEKWLKATFHHPPNAVLTRVDRDGYDRKWLLEVTDGADSYLKLLVAIPPAFPKEMLRVYWLHGTDKTYPHCFPDGNLCLTDQPPNFIDLERDLDHIFQRVNALVVESLNQTNTDDFYSEPFPYWNAFIQKRKGQRWRLQRAKVFNAAPLAKEECHQIYGYRDYSGIWYVASDSNDAHQLASLSSEGIDELSYSVGVRVPLDKPWHPDDFPRTWKQVYGLLLHSGQITEVLTLLEIERKKDPWLATIILYFDAPGVSYGFIVPSEWDNGRAHDQRFVKRPLKNIAILDFFKLAMHGPIWHCETYELDTERLFSRLGIENMSPRQSANVLLAGCGSLGGMVIEELVLAGVRRITLVDHDSLSAGNLCRHVLGMKDLGLKKTTALKKHLCNRMPLLEIDTFNGTVEDFLYQSQGPKADDFDLILAMTGESGPIWMLDSWREGHSPEAVPMLVGWAEPYGYAGHAALLRNGKTLHDIEDRTTRSHNMFEWPAGTDTTLIQEPGCSSTFQPMGRSKILYAVAINTELALKVLDGDIDSSVVYSHVEPELNARAKQAKSKIPELHNSIADYNSAVVVRDV